MTILHLAKLIILNEPMFLCDLLRINENKPKRNNRIYLPNLSLKHYKNNFCYQGPKLWNILCFSPTYCENITTAPTLNCLKSRLKRLFLKMQTYGDESEWLPVNKNLEAYLTVIKSGP